MAISACDISVVIPLYNKKEKVSDCIFSVLNQKAMPKEIVVIDDGSTDGSCEVAQEILSKSSIKHKIKKQNNSGVASARNKGVEIAEGAYIAFLDADDEWDEDFICELVRLINLYPGALIYSCSHRIKYKKGVRSNVSNVFRDDQCGLVPGFFKVYSRTDVVNSSKVIVDREGFWRAGGFPEGVDVNEDIFLWVRLARMGKVAYLQKTLVTINQFDDSSRGRRSRKLPYLIEYYAANRGELKEAFGLKEFVWRVSYSHLIGDLAVGREVAWPMFQKIAIIFPVRSLFLLFFFLVPGRFISWMIAFKRRSVGKNFYQRLRRGRSGL